MSDSIKAQIIADSANPCGHRLTTFLLEYPRFIHSEVMTHRVFSKNAASSRAIPVEKIIQQVMENPAMPVYWGKNQSGMQAKEELDNAVKSMSVQGILGEYHVTPMEFCKSAWLDARDEMVVRVRELSSAGLHKQTANRLLEPWFNIRVILSGTEYENFFALRAHPDAQPELQELAYKMLNAYSQSKPRELKSGEFHIPFGDNIDENRLREYYYSEQFKAGNSSTEQLMPFTDLKIKIAVARCARVSYFNFEGKDDYAKDIDTCNKLFGSVPRHLSPAEHVAMAIDSSDFIGNFRGFKQYRKFFDDENLSDSRIMKI